MDYNRVRSDCTDKAHIDMKLDSVCKAADKTGEAKL
jgi:hypothetical protein